jgi:AcrR family transcriptional regulator
VIAGDPVPRRGRPRSEAANDAILAAALQLGLEVGLEHMTMDAIAERAGVSKATIYRRWPSKLDCTLDALFGAWSVVPGEDVDTGLLRADLLALLLPWAAAATPGTARLVAAVIAETRKDRALHERFVIRFVEPRRATVRHVFRRAVERGEIPHPANLGLAIDLLYGTLYHRWITRNASLDERVVRQLVDVVIAGLRSGAAG